MEMEIFVFVGYLLIALFVGVFVGVLLSGRFIRPKIAGIMRKLKHLQLLNDELNKELVAYHMVERTGNWKTI